MKLKSNCITTTNAILDIRKIKAIKLEGSTSVDTPKKSPRLVVTLSALIESMLILKPMNPKKLSLTCL